MININITNSATVTLEGLNITGGSGSGIYAVAGTLTVTHSTVSGNSGGFDGHGGGIYAVDGTLTVTNSTLASNSASSGGALYIDSNASVTNVTFSRNSATDSGGAMLTGSTLTLTNVIL